VSSNAFVWLIVAALALGGSVGGTVYALVGGDDSSQPPSLNAFDSPTATPSDTAPPDAIFIPGDRQLGGGRFPRGGQQFELITGSVESLDATTLVLSNSDGTVEIAVDTETPVRISKTAADAGDALAAGTEILAILSRDSSGTITANNINVVGGDGGAVGRAGRGGGFRASGFRGGDGSINIATGTVDGFADGVLTLDTGVGAVDILVADDTPVSWQKSFADAGEDLAPGTEITATGSRAEDGTFQPFTIATGSLALQMGASGGMRGQRGTGDRR
jgi:hypothetical protein